MVHRGTSNTNVRGNTADRRARRLWLLTTFGDGVKAPCYRCGAMLDNSTMTVDRRIPGIDGGTYRRDNIRPACPSCNSETGGHLAHRNRKEPIMTTSTNKIKVSSTVKKNGGRDITVVHTDGREERAFLSAAGLAAVSSAARDKNAGGWVIEPKNLRGRSREALVNAGVLTSGFVGTLTELGQLLRPYAKRWTK